MKTIKIALLITLIVFAYCSADNAVSPLVSIFHLHFKVSEAAVLYLIASCTFGIVVGSLIGPVLVAKYTARKLMLFATLILALATIVFFSINSFPVAIISRLIFGICSGLLAAVIWWITFHGVTGKGIDIMLAVALTARPVAMSLGIPLVGLITAMTNWQIAYAFLVVILLVATFGLYCILEQPQNSKLQPPTSLLIEYRDVFSLTHSINYYLGMTLNSIGYFGFYSLAGIWFSQHYHLSFLQIATMFLFIGGAEVIINFISPVIFRTFAFKQTIIIVCLGIPITYALFIYAQFSLYLALSFIILFIMLNRALVYACLRTLPVMFSTHQNKTTLGSLVTLSLWLGFAIASGLQGKLLANFSIQVVETMLLGMLILGTMLIFITQKQGLFKVITKIT